MHACCVYVYAYIYIMHTYMCAPVCPCTQPTTVAPKARGSYIHAQRITCTYTALTCTGKVTPSVAPEGFSVKEATVEFNLTIPRAKIYVSELSPRAGSVAGGTDVRITLTGLRIDDTSSASSIPPVMFGSAPAASVSVVVSDLDVTIIRASTPQANSAGVVTVVVAGEGNASFAYMSDGVSATCTSRVCEVDALAGGTLTMRVGGLKITDAANVGCMIDGKAAMATSVTARGAGLFDIVLLLPGAGRDLDNPLTMAFMSLSAAGDSVTVYADVLYRSPPRATLAEIGSETSLVNVIFDQETNGSGPVLCTRYVESQRAGALGEAPTCVWSDDGIKLSIIFGKGATLTVGDGLFFFAGTVKSRNGVSSSNQALRRANNGQTLLTIRRPFMVLPPM
jgi:hypothetical protein